MIPQVDELLYPAIKYIFQGPFGRIYHHPFGPKRQACPAADAVDIYGERLYDPAPVDFNRTFVSVNGGYLSGKFVVFTDKLGNKAVFRFLIKHIRCRELLNHAVVKNGDSIRHGYRH